MAWRERRRRRRGLRCAWDEIRRLSVNGRRCLWIYVVGQILYLFICEILRAICKIGECRTLEGYHYSSSPLLPPSFPCFSHLLRGKRRKRRTGNRDKNGRGGGGGGGDAPVFHPSTKIGERRGRLNFSSIFLALSSLPVVVSWFYIINFFTSLFPFTGRDCGWLIQNTETRKILKIIALTFDPCYPRLSLFYQNL